MSTQRLEMRLAIGALAVAILGFGSALAESNVRIVRLSEVQGKVQIDRGAGDGFDKAFLNLPIVEGSRLKTGDDGRAEVEFEDGSALRLAPNSEVAFLHLALGDDGQKISTVQLVSGKVYANLHPRTAYGKGKDASGDQFQLNFGRESLSVPEAAHFRLNLSDAQATLAVFKGKVSATSPAGQVEVAEKHSATIALAKDEPANESASAKAGFLVARNVDSDENDGWDRQQNEYHDRYASAGGSSIASPYAYGMSDLNYYGNFLSVPGYGSVWQPYFAGAGWNPYQDGGWAYYPGSGYTFVSGYPWGWMPYRYGNWVFVPGFGWVWQPGGWNTWNAVPRSVNSPGRVNLLKPPLTGRQTVMVGRGLAANPVAGTTRLTINPNSAGYGVPRGSVRHLDRVSKTVERTSHPATVSAAPPAQADNSGFGSASARVTAAPMGMAHHSAGPVAGSRPH
jgi:hypothetical protein